MSENPIKTSDVEPEAPPKPAPRWWEQEPYANGSDKPHLMIVTVTPAMAMELLAVNRKPIVSSHRETLGGILAPSCAAAAGASSARAGGLGRSCAPAEGTSNGPGIE